MLCECHNMKKGDGDVYYKGNDGRIYKRREFGPRRAVSLAPRRERPAPHEGEAGNSACLRAGARLLLGGLHVGDGGRGLEIGDVDAVIRSGQW